jgi:hypothetical protein
VKGKGSKDGPSKPPHYGHYSNEEYRVLNKKQQMKLKQHRNKNEDKGLAEKRRTSAVVTSDANEDDDNKETTPPKKKKTKNGRTVNLVSMTETPLDEDLLVGYVRRPKPTAAAKMKEAAELFEDWEDLVWTFKLLTRRSGWPG